MSRLGFFHLYIKILADNNYTSNHYYHYFQNQKLTVIEHIQCAKHCPKVFPCIINSLILMTAIGVGTIVLISRGRKLKCSEVA